jgi:hypothetical protein
MEKIKIWWIEDIQEQGTKMYRIQGRLRHVKNKIKPWNQEVFGNIVQTKKELEIQMEDIQKYCIQDGYNEEKKMEEKQLHREWEKRCMQEEILWRQKSRVQWLKAGEKNTKFFHKSTIAHRNHNSYEYQI